jgi:quercetin dioxygenase-like cupin family protein
MAFDFWHARHDEPPIVIPAIGLELWVRLPPAASGGALTVIETIHQPGLGPPLHRHRETEVFRILAGRYLFEVDGKRFTADTGDLVSVPGGAAHAFINVAEQPARQLTLIMPGMDAAAFFTRLAAAMKGGAQNLSAVNALVREWGVEYIGPPLRGD